LLFVLFFYLYNLCHFGWGIVFTIVFFCRIRWFLLAEEREQLQVDFCEILEKELEDYGPD